MIMICANIFGQNFPGNRLELIKGKQLKIKELIDLKKSYIVYHFYKSNVLDKKSHNSIYNAKILKYEEVAGLVFDFISAESYKGSYGEKKYLLRLNNPKIGIMFLDYDPFDRIYPFIVVGSNSFPEGYFCKNITTNQLKNEIKITSPLNQWPLTNISFLKTINGNDRHTFIILKVSWALYKEKNTEKESDKKIEAYLKFENDETLHNIYGKTLNVINGCTSFIFELNEKEINLLTTNKLLLFEIYSIEGQEHAVLDSFTLREYIKCISKM